MSRVVTSWTGVLDGSSGAAPSCIAGCCVTSSYCALACRRDPLGADICAAAWFPPRTRSPAPLLEAVPVASRAADRRCERGGEARLRHAPGRLSGSSRPDRSPTGPIRPGRPPVLRRCEAVQFDPAKRWWRAHGSPRCSDPPCTDWSLSVAWGTEADLPATLVPSHLVDEISADVARDRHGRRHHLVRYQRIRAESHPMHVPEFKGPDQPPLAEDSHQQAWPAERRMDAVVGRWTPRSVRLSQLTDRSQMAEESVTTSPFATRPYEGP